MSATTHENNFKQTFFTVVQNSWFIILCADDFVLLNIILCILKYFVVAISFLWHILIMIDEQGKKSKNQ